MSKIEKGNYNAAASAVNIIFDPIIKKSLKCPKCDFETSRKIFWKENRKSKESIQNGYHRRYLRMCYLPSEFQTENVSRNPLIHASLKLHQRERIKCETQ